MGDDAVARLGARARVLVATLAIMVGVVGCGLATLSGEPGASQPVPATLQTGATAIPTSQPSPGAKATPAGTASEGGALTVEEYPIAAKEVDAPGRLEYSKRIDPGILEKRRAWRGFDRERLVDGVNRSLGRFGYRLAGNERSDHPHPLYDLLEGDTILLKNVDFVWPIAVNARGDDFALVVETKQGHQYLVNRSGAAQWDPGQHAFMRPVFVGDDLVTVETGEQEGWGFTVRRAGRTVHTQIEAPGTRVDHPVKGLWSWDGHWVLEVDGEVLVDGQSLNQQLGYDEIFGWRLLAGQPLYFFKRGGRIGLSYAGQALPHRYQEVIHYKCCEPAAFNLAGNDTMVWFHALKEGVWHYVEAGVYSQPPA